MTASDPYASAVHTESKPQRSASSARPTQNRPDRRIPVASRGARDDPTRTPCRSSRPIATSTRRGALSRVHGGARLSERGGDRPRGRRRADAARGASRPRARGAGCGRRTFRPRRAAPASGFLYYACLNEEIGRSAYAQLVFGCQAPDAGNAEILHLFGTDEQKERFLRPLVAGEVRSFFSMTEPEVAGVGPDAAADARRARRRRVGDRRAQVVLERRRRRGLRHRHGDHRSRRRAAPAREPMILVPADTPGVEVVRAGPGDGAHGARLAARTARCATRACACPSRTRSASEGDALPHRAEAARPGADPPRDALARADAARVRADVPRTRSSARRSAGRWPSKQTVQNWIADSAAEIQACRLLTMDAARKIDERLGGARRGLADQVLRRPDAARRDRPRDPGARRARPHRRDAACGDVRDGPRRRGSTTARTRCTGWSSRGGS